MRDHHHFWIGKEGDDPGRGAAPVVTLLGVARRGGTRRRPAFLLGFQRDSVMQGDLACHQDLPAPGPVGDDP